MHFCATNARGFLELNKVPRAQLFLVTHEEQMSVQASPHRQPEQSAFEQVSVKYFDSRHGRMLRTILASMAIVLALHAPSAGVRPLLHTFLLSARLLQTKLPLRHHFITEQQPRSIELINSDTRCMWSQTVAWRSCTALLL